MFRSLRSIYPRLSTSKKRPSRVSGGVNLIVSYIGFCRENSKLEREIVLPTPTRANIFAVPLEDLMGYDGEKDGIPRVIKDSIQYLRETGMCFPSFLSLCLVILNALVGLEEEGLFRRSPNLTLLNQVTDAYDRGERGSSCYFL
jgi:hypothetical protein